MWAEKIKSVNINNHFKQLESKQNQIKDLK